MKHSATACLITITLTLLLVVPSLEVSAEEYGSIVHAGIEMKVEGVVAVWNPENRRVGLILLPFAPDAEEIELCRRGRESRIKRELIDPDKWSQINPRASYTLGWMQDSDIGEWDASLVHLFAYGIGETNANVNLNYMMEFAKDMTNGARIEQTVTGKVEPGTELHLVSSGEDELSGETITWDLDVRTKILTPLPRGE